MKKILFMAFVAIISLGASAQATQKTKAASTESQIVIQTNGTCQMCADRFKENVPFFKGVKTFSYDMKTAKLTINYDPSVTTPDQLRKEISKMGYNADNVQADPAAREKLPACCKGEKSCSGSAATHTCSGQCQNHKDGNSSQCQGHKDGKCTGTCQGKSANKNDKPATK